VDDQGGTFRTHLEPAALAVALKRRVNVLQAVEHAQSDPGNLFENFTRALKRDQQRLDELESGIAGVLVSPPLLTTFTIEESILQRPTGGNDVHGEQLRQLIKVAALRSVELHIMPTCREEHPSLGGPFILLTPKGRQQVGYLEIQNTSKLVTDPEEVRILAARYGSIRGQALNPRESVTLIEKILGEL
jgi:hypothetical protein